MSLYWYLFRFNALRFLTYPTEILATFLRRILHIVFFVFLWTLVLKGSSTSMNTRELISYFLIAVGLSEIVIAKWGGPGKWIADHVKRGKISNYFIKPIPIIPAVFFTELGVNIPGRFIGAVYLIVGLAINPPQTLTSVFLFFVFFISSFILSHCYGLLLGCMYFYVPEASGIKNSIDHMARVLSGVAIPLTFFPNDLLKIVKLLPFQAMVYAPAKALTTNYVSSEVVSQIVVSYAWLIIFVLSSRFIWRQSIKNYEASGI